MTSNIIITTIYFLALCSWGCPYFGPNKTPTSKQASHSGETCFCMLRGNVDDCSCKIETIDGFNSVLIQPKLANLLKYSYFRYFKVNMRKDCPFWNDDGRCALKDCAVQECGENDLPVGLKGRIRSESKSWRGESANAGAPIDKMGVTPSCKEERNLSAVDASLTAENEKSFEAWKMHDDRRNNFCELDDEHSDDLQYVDLLKNPERFTGYSGPSAHRVWNSIYQENCFKDEQSSYQQLLTQGVQGSPDEGLCLEKRVYYRLLSGLHASINVHLSAQYLLKGSPFDKYSGIWGPNVAEFMKRFDPIYTKGRGPQWLKNLYFLYLLELRALKKATPYLIEREKFFTGNQTEDKEVKRFVEDILDTVSEFEGHFDESSMFSNAVEGLALKDEFRLKFRNISRIMDCVGCDKCKLWGKLQITGLGTALKILFPPDEAFQSSESFVSSPSFHLQRSEIVALFNAFGRVSSSIEYVHMFKDLLGSGG